MNIFRRKKKQPNWKVEHNRLWDELVPDSGQAETLQGEIIRIVGKLTDQAYRNGNMNWDDEHEYLWRFVGDHLSKSEVFSKEVQEQIINTVNTIIRDEECPDVSGEGSTYYFICEKAVDWCLATPELIPHTVNPDITR